MSRQIEINLSPEQQAAVKMAFEHPLSVLTGGPGTGKTTTLKTLILTRKRPKSYALASPTGRAAKRLSEATGSPRQHHSPPARALTRARVSSSTPAIPCQWICWLSTKSPCSTWSWPTTCLRRSGRAPTCC